MERIISLLMIRMVKLNMLASKSQVATVRTREWEVLEESSYLEMELTCE